MNKKGIKNQEKENAIVSLHKYLKPDDTVYTVLRHCSSSGMSRRIDCVIPFINEYNGKIDVMDITNWVALATGMKQSNKDGAIIMGGCGMDMGFALVYALSSVMYEGKDRAGYILNRAWL